MENKDLKTYECMLPERRLDPIQATSEHEAELKHIRQLRKMFESMTDEELIDKLSIIVWEK